MPDLDQIIAAAKPGDTINLPSGIYYTQGSNAYPTNPSGAVLPANVTLFGSGPKTLLKLKHPGTVGDRVVVYGAGGGITLRNLAIDCGPLPSAGWTSKICGACIRGANPVFDSVHVIRAFGSVASNNEGFGIISFGSKPVVKNCYLSWMQGDYVSAIQVSLDSPVVLNNTVILPTKPATVTPGWFMTGINLAAAVNASVTGNAVYNGNHGIYSDTGDLMACDLNENILLGQAFGIHLNAQCFPGQQARVLSGLNFRRNRIITDQSWNDYASVLIDNTCNPYDPNGVSKGVRVYGLVFDRNEATSHDGSPLRFVNIATQAATGDATAGIDSIQFIGNSVPAGALWRNMGGKATDLSVLVDASPTWDKA